MKKLLALTLALLFVTAQAGCGLVYGTNNSAAQSSPSSPAAPSALPALEEAGDPIKSAANNFGKDLSDIGIVMIINTNLGDKSFCDLSYEGLLKISDEYGCRVRVVELSGDATKQVPTMIEFAEDPDWDIIIAGTYNILESMQTVAEEFPEQKFIMYDARDNLGLPNIYSVEHMQNEGSFLVGAAAAMLTDSDAELANDEKVIGFIGGSENTAINDFLVGYIQGAQYIDPDCKVLISYVGDFRDTAKAKEMAIAQINQGADVVFAVAGGAGLGVLDACREKNVYAIGVDADQAIVLEESSPELAARICTSMVKKVDVTVYNALSNALEGGLPWGTYESAGLAAGSVGAARNKYFEAIFSPAQQARLSEVEAGVASGELSVETAVGMENTRLNEIRDSARP